MEKEENVEVLDGANEDQPVDLTAMTREELEEYAAKNAKAFGDQKKLVSKLKSKPTPVEPEPAAEPVVEPVITPEPAAAEPASLDDQYVIANLSKQFSLEEIKEGQSFIGTSFGTTLEEVAANPGFLAHINAKRELSKSDDMIDDSPIEIETFQSKESFVKDVESGKIDLQDDPKSREKYIGIKAEQEAAKGF